MNLKTRKNSPAFRARFAKTMSREFWDAAFAGDGQCFKTRGGLGMDELVKRAGLWAQKMEYPHQGTRIHLRDAVVLVYEGAWDYWSDDCVCGYCWEGADVECAAIAEV